MKKTIKETNLDLLKSRNIDIQDENRLKYFHKDDVIFFEGQPGNEAYYIKEGNVNIYRISANKRILLDCLHPGEIFGEMSILDGEPRNANAIANDDVILVVIEKDILTSTMDDALPLIQYLATSLIMRLRKTNQKINEKPSNNTLLSVCTVLHLLFDRLLSSQSSLNDKSPKNGIHYYDLCTTLKDIVPLAEVDIQHVLDHLTRQGYIKVLNKTDDNNLVSKWIIIQDAKEFNTMIQHVKSSGGWGIENDPFIQDQEFIDLMDFAQRMNESPENLLTMILNDSIPKNLLFFHRVGVLSWMEKRQKKKMYQRLYNSPFDNIKKEKSWVV